MKNHKVCRIVILFALLFVNVYAQETIGNGELGITIENTGHGVKLLSIKKGNTELLDTKVSSVFFTMTVDKIFLTPLNGWDSVSVANNGTECSILLTKPSNPNLPKTLSVLVTIKTSGNKSDWDMSVSGLNTSSLLEVHFPYLNVLAEGDDYAFIPKHSGQIIKNPRAKNINEALTYPRWVATMQYCAYYNDRYGIYFGTHDPKASIKEFIVKANIKNGVKFETKLPIPNKTIAGNDWEYSGVFRLELFEGNWYDAAMIYRKWASEEAEYWPKDTPERIARRNAAGNIALWMMIWDQKNSISQIRNWVNNFADYMGVPIGMHWYNWNNIEFDDNYPYFFPAKAGMDKLVKELESSGRITIMPYINGRLYDKGLPNYSTEGKIWAAKDEAGNVHTQKFGNIYFAVECPTQTGYQDIITDVCKQLTETDQIGCGSVYIDQVAYARAQECYDKNHGHKIGGGDAWRSGYNQMFEKMHAAVAEDKFFTSEGNCDFIADEVDGFLAQQWRIDNLVPAFQAVYSGKVQYFGTIAGHNGDQRYFAEYANSFVNGVQPGRFYPSTVTNSVTAPYVRKMGRMRYKLKEYLSFGRMLKPIEIDRSGIDDITTNWGKGPVTISALQASLWKNSAESKAMLLLANASVSKTINFNLNFDGASRGLYGKLKIQRITESSEGNILTKENSFSMNIQIQPKDIIAYVIEPDSIETDVKEENLKLAYKLEQNYPNPFNPSTVIGFSLAKAGNTRVEVYNMLGQKVATLLNKELGAGSHKVKFNGSNLSSGIYFYKLQSDNFISIKKMILMK